MSYDVIVIDSIMCDSYLEVMYDGENPIRDSLLGLQIKSAELVADKQEGLLCITSETKELMETKYCNGDFPMSLSCLLSSCEEINILCKDESDSIIKASSLLSWKKINFCVLTGNSLLKKRLESLGIKVFDLSQSDELFNSL